MIVIVAVIPLTTLMFILLSHICKSGLLRVQRACIPDTRAILYIFVFPTFYFLLSGFRGSAPDRSRRRVAPARSRETRSRALARWHPSALAVAENGNCPVQNPRKRLPLLEPGEVFLIEREI